MNKYWFAFLGWLLVVLVCLAGVVGWFSTALETGALLDWCLMAVSVGGAAVAMGNAEDAWEKIP